MNLIQFPPHRPSGSLACLFSTLYLVSIPFFPIMTTDSDVAVTLDNIQDILKHDIRVKVAAVDIDGVLRGKVLHKTKFLQVVQDGFGLCIL